MNVVWQRVDRVKTHAYAKPDECFHFQIMQTFSNVAATIHREWARQGGDGQRYQEMVFDSRAAVRESGRRVAHVAIRQMIKMTPKNKNTRLGGERRWFKWH